MGNGCSSYDDCTVRLRNNVRMDPNNPGFTDMKTYMSDVSITQNSMMPTVNLKEFTFDINYVHTDTGCHEDWDGSKVIPRDVAPKIRYDVFQTLIDTDRCVIVSACFGKHWHGGNDSIIQRLIWITVTNPENLNNRAKWATIKFTDEGDNRIPTKSQVFENKDVSPLGNWDGIDEVQVIGPSFVNNTNPLRARALSGVVTYTGDGITGASFRFTDILDYSDIDVQEIGYPKGNDNNNRGICQRFIFKGDPGDFINSIDLGISNHQAAGSGLGGVKRVQNAKFIKLQTFTKAINTVDPNKCCDQTVSRYADGTVLSYACVFSSMIRGTDNCTRSFLDVCKTDLENMYCKNYCDNNDCSEILSAYCTKQENKTKDMCSCTASNDDPDWLDFKRKLEGTMGKLYADVLSAKPECYYDRCTQRGIKTKAMKDSKCELSIQDCRNITTMDNQNATFKNSPVYNTLKNTCNQVIAGTPSTSPPTAQSQQSPSFPSPPSPLPSYQPPEKKDNDESENSYIVWIIVAVVIAVLLIASLVGSLYWKNKTQQSIQEKNM